MTIAERTARPLLRATTAVDPPASSAVARSRIEPGNARVERLLHEIIAELRGLRADMRRRESAAPALVAALGDFFGPGRFTVSGVLSLADEERALGSALGEAIDMNASPRGRATALGTLLARLPEVETVAQQRGGVAVYRLQTCGQEV